MSKKALQCPGQMTRGSVAVWNCIAAIVATAGQVGQALFWAFPIGPKKQSVYYFQVIAYIIN